MTSLDPDQLHRTAKLLVDTDVAATLQEAQDLLESLRVQILVGTDAAHTAAGQAACLTAINTAHRAFLGGCLVVLYADPAGTIPWAAGDVLSRAVQQVGGTITTTVEPDLPTICIGDVTPPAGTNRVVWATWDGWVAAAVDNPHDRLDEPQGLELAGIVAGGLAVSETFQALTGSKIATQRNIGLSLWRPDLPYLDPQAQGPEPQYLPTALWLLGLGHLGQATAWAIGTLPYREPHEVRVCLMDPDHIVQANQATPLLAHPRDIGTRKARLVAHRLDTLGMTTTVIERRFSPELAVGPDEPAVAISGFDNPGARAHLEDAGFQRVVDLGLGGGAAYNDILVHTFPAPTPAAEVFSARRQPSVDLDKYERSIDEIVSAGVVDSVAARCGMVELAGTTASASFVGAIAGALGVADLLRALHLGTDYDVINLDLRTGRPATASPSPTPRPRTPIAYGQISPRKN